MNHQRATAPPLKRGLRGCACHPGQLPALAKELCQLSQSLVWFWTRSEEYNYIEGNDSTGPLVAFLFVCLNGGEDLEFEKWP